MKATLFLIFILGLSPPPVPVAKVFNFTLQREVNRELEGK
jgi:hypothetical protein